MKKYFYIFAVISVLTAVSCSVFAATAPENWEKLEKRVRDNTIQKQQAKDFVKVMRPLLDSYYDASACGNTHAAFVFPVEAYGRSAIGGKKGSGYIPKGYDFFDSEKHGDHPAQDIFIRDSNHDCKDDHTGRPIRIVSASAGVVVSVSTGWEKGGILRGGNYVWVYDPGVKGLYYYAHMDKVTVKTGDILEPGEALGTVGRTGKNAYIRRSPTHLHFMFLSYGKDGSLKPVNIYKSLITRTAPAVK